MTLTYRYGTRRHQRHALEVERTEGDHFVWTCRCERFTLVQDPRDNPADIHVILIKHATEPAQR